MSDRKRIGIDRNLGEDRRIPRRDFLQGALVGAATVLAGPLLRAYPGDVVESAAGAQARAGYYPSAREVAITYIRDGKAFAVRARGCVLAGYNAMFPYLCPELPEAQKAAAYTESAIDQAHRAVGELLSG
jgi:hypothetical protein